MPLAHLGDLDLHFQRRGTGPPVVGIMGFGIDQRFWAAQIPVLIEGNEFVSFDNRGVGRSTGSPVASIEQMGEDALRLLDHLEIERATFFGVSMGGAIAQRIALDHPQRVQALVLAVTWARPLEFMRRQILVAAQVVEAGGPEAMIDASLIWMFTPRFFEMGREVIDPMVRAFVAESGPGPAPSDVLRVQLEALAKHDVAAHLKEIEHPALVVGGRYDMMVPGFASEELAAALPNSELVMLDAGHGLMVEAMDDFNKHLRKFLERHAR